ESQSYVLVFGKGLVSSYSAKETLFRSFYAAPAINTGIENSVLGISIRRATNSHTPIWYQGSILASTCACSSASARINREEDSRISVMSDPSSLSPKWRSARQYPLGTAPGHRQGC